MYKNARRLPLGGFRHGGSSGLLDDGPTPAQLAGKARYEERLEAERRAQRELQAARKHAKKFGHGVRRRPPQRAP